MKKGLLIIGSIIILVVVVYLLSSRVLLSPDEEEIQSGGSAEEMPISELFSGGKNSASFMGFLSDDVSVGGFGIFSKS